MSRIARTTAALTKLKLIWNDKNIAISSKIRLMRSLAMSTLLYACETWTITADIERRIQALEVRCFRKLLGISHRDYISNEEVKARIGNAIGPYEVLLSSVKRLKLRWYGHVTRSSGLANGSKQLPALHTVECSMYWTLAGRSSGENASLFRALPLYSCYDAPSPLADVRSSCQFNCGAFFFFFFFVNHHSLQLVSSLFTQIQ